MFGGSIESRSVVTVTIGGNPDAGSEIDYTRRGGTTTGTTYSFMMVENPPIGAGISGGTFGGGESDTGGGRRKSGWAYSTF